MSLIVWVVFGLVVGVIANAIDPQPSRGEIIGAVVLGVGGALVGGFVSSLLTGYDVTGFNITSLIIAVMVLYLYYSLQDRLEERNWTKSSLRLLTA